MEKIEIEVGTLSKKQLISELCRREQKEVDWHARQLLTAKEFVVEENRRVIIAIVAVGELGLRGGFVKLSDVYRKAETLGMGLCPVEVGPQMLLQKIDGFCNIAMPRIDVSNICGGVFSVGKNSLSMEHLSRYSDYLEGDGAWRYSEKAAKSAESKRFAFIMI